MTEDTYLKESMYVAQKREDNLAYAEDAVATYVEKNPGVNADEVRNNVKSAQLVQDSDIEEMLEE